MRLGSRLLAHSEQHQLGEVFNADTGFRLRRDPDTVRLPDVSFVSRERWQGVQDREAYFEGPPDLAVETVPPSDSANEVHEKALMWLEAGVRLLWVIHPRQRSATVYTPDRHARVLRADDTLDGEDVLPGFSVVVRELFE